MKKGQGLSLNVIIVAAIVLIVLVVLWAIFTGRMGLFAQGLAQAEQKCNEVCTAAGYSVSGTGLENEADCKDANEVILRSLKVKEGNNIVPKVCCCIKPT